MSIDTILKPKTDKEITESLNKYDDGKQFLFSAAKLGRLQLVKVALNHGVDIHAYDDNALRLACVNNNFETAKYLISKGGDLHAYDDSALRESAANGHAKIVKLLLKHGANPHAYNNSAFRWSGNTEVSRLLKKYSTKPIKLKL